MLGLFLGRELGAVALVEQARDFPLAIEDALALHFGRVRGQHRPHLGSGEKPGELRRTDAGFLGTGQRQRQAAFARRGPGAGMGAAAADVVLVLGDVGQVREVTEGAHHHVGAFARQAAQQGIHFLARRAVGIAMEAQREPADLLDAIENFGAFLFAHGVAEQAAEQADVVAQGLVLVGAGVRAHLRAFSRARLSSIARSR